MRDIVSCMECVPAKSPGKFSWSRTASSCGRRPGARSVDGRHASEQRTRRWHQRTDDADASSDQRND